MTDLMKDASDWLCDTLKDNASEVVTVSRTGQTDFTVSARVGETTFEQLDETGVLEQFERRDYLIHVADYDFGSGAVEPQRGDRITRTNTSGYVYEVSGEGSGPPKSESDRYGKVWRVHTVRVS